MRFVYSDGGRSNYFKGLVDDCVVRAICNATGKDYKEVYNGINQLAKSERLSKYRTSRSSARDGVHKDTTRKYIESIGWMWIPRMSFGTGCTTHLNSAELPKGDLIVSVSKHLTCVKDGVLYDTFDCSRGGDRCVYGYFVKAPDTKRVNEIRKQIQEHKEAIKILEKELDECKGVRWFK